MAADELERSRIGWIEERDGFTRHECNIAEACCHGRRHNGTEPTFVDGLFATDDPCLIGVIVLRGNE